MEPQYNKVSRDWEKCIHGTSHQEFVINEILLKQIFGKITKISVTSELNTVWFQKVRSNELLA